MNIYADIIHQPRPESSHPRMRREERAKLFAPFAALSGHDQAVHDREKVLVPRVLMTDYALEELDRKLQALQKRRRHRHLVSAPPAGRKRGPGAVFHRRRHLREAGPL